MPTHTPCPSCRQAGRDRSGDNLVVYEDGNGSHCFACGYHTNGDGSVTTPKPPAEFKPIQGSYGDIGDRGIHEKTCRKYGVTQTDAGTHIYPYYSDDKQLIGQHIRKKPKGFSWRTDKAAFAKHFPLFGQHLWQPNPKLGITITEGEIDCLTLAQVDGCKWPVVSLPNGAESAEKAIRRNSEYLCGFKEVIICFDMDEPGRAAAVKAAELLPPGKVRIVELPRKDANEMAQAADTAGLKSAIMSAKTYRPDGVREIKDIAIDLDEDLGVIYEYPWDDLTETLLGRRPGELWVLTAGTGCGKTTFAKEMIYQDLLDGHRVGVLALEESVKDTKLDIAGVHMSRPVRKRQALNQLNKLRQRKGKPPLLKSELHDFTPEELQTSLGWLDTQPLYLYDHFGSQDTDVILSRIRYMASGLQCPIIYLDHLSIVISGQEADDERKEIDRLMTKLRSIAEETEAHIVVISHLRKANGKSHEDGGRVSADDLRGSGGIKQLADGILGLERDADDSGDSGSNRVHVRCLKDRLGGYRGVAATLDYIPATGRMIDAEGFQNESGHDPY